MLQLYDLQRKLFIVTYVPHWGCYSLSTHLSSLALNGLSLDLIFF